MKKDIRKQVLDALNQLMSGMPYDKITIPMLADYAGISKATFYRYFKDKQDVLCTNYDLLLETAKEQSHSLPELFFLLSKGFYDLGKRTGTEILGYKGANNYMEYVYKRSYDFLCELFYESTGRNLSADHLFQCRILIAGIAFHLELLSIHTPVPEDMRHNAQIIADLFPEEVKSLTWRYLPGRISF